MSFQYKPEESEESKKVRASLTTRIWGFATVMLAIITPGFVTPHHSPDIIQLVVSLAILSAAGMGAAAVWGAFGGRSRSALPPSSTDLKHLEERLANLEMITS